MKTGWFFRGADRMILHRTAKDGPALPVLALPPVEGRVTYRMSDRRHTKLAFLLGTAEGPRVASTEAVHDGTWADICGVERPVGQDQRNAAAIVLSKDLMAAPEVPAVPVKDRDGALHLPAAESQELGYLRVGDPDEEAARKAWLRICELATLADRTTLSLGAFFGGPIYSALRSVPAHVLNHVGRGQRGKSSVQKVQAGTLGSNDPSFHIFRGLNTTSNALPERLIEARYLPMGREEVSSGGWTRPQLEGMISKVLGGGQRDRLDSSGASRPTVGPWHSLLSLSSNETLLRPGQPESFASRLIELREPFWSGESEADEAVDLATQYHGWPLVWAEQEGFFTAEKVQEWRELHIQITGRLTTASGGIPLTQARVLAAWCVGAYMLGAVMRMPQLGERAVEDAQAELPRVVDDAAEAHLSPGHVLWNAVAGALSEEPLSWLQVADLVKPEPKPDNGWIGKGQDQAPADAVLRARKVLGYWYESEHGTEVHVYAKALKDITTAAGIEVAEPGLGDLRRLGVLRVTQTRGFRSKPTAGKLRDAVQGMVYMVNVDRARELFEDQEAAVETVVPGQVPVPEAGSPIERAEALASLPVPAARRPQETAQEAVTTAAGVVTTDVPTDVPTAAQGPSRGVTASRRHDVTTSDVPPMPEHPPAVPYPPAADRVTDRAWVGLAARARGRTASAMRFGVLGSDGLHLPNRAPVKVAVPASVNDVPALMAAYGLKTLWLHADMLPVLGLPAYDPLKEGGPQAGTACSWATPGDAIASMTPEAGASCWMTLSTPEGRRLSLAIPAYEDRMDRKAGAGRGGFGGAADAAELLDALMVYLLSTVHGPKGRPQVVPYYLSPNRTGEDYAGGKDRDDVVCEAIRRREVPPISTPLLVSTGWSRPLTDTEQAAAWLHRYDKTAAYLGAYSNVALGVGEPQHASEGRPYDKALAGWWRLADVPGTGPEGLPTLTLTEAEEGGYWLSTPEVDLLAELYGESGWVPEVIEAYYWPTSKRALAGMYELLRKGREYILHAIEQGRPGARWAKQVNARVYQSFRGYLGRVEPKRDHTTGEVYAGDIYWRPDWAKLIVAHAMVNTYRGLRKFAKDGGPLPLSLSTDAVTYVADSPDPVEAKPELMQLGTKGGQWTHEGAVPMAQALPYLKDGKNAHEALDLCLSEEG